MEPVSVAHSLSGISNFLLYFLSSLVFLGIFKAVYPLVTPHKEWHLVKEERNAAASTAFTGAFVGFSIALGSAASNSIAYVDFIIWAVVALAAQVIAYFMVHFMMSGFATRIQNQEMSAGIFAGGTSIAVGILNASCMTY